MSLTRVLDIFFQQNSMGEHLIMCFVPGAAMLSPGGSNDVQIYSPYILVSYIINPLTNPA